MENAPLYLILICVRKGMKTKKDGRLTTLVTSWQQLSSETHYWNNDRRRDRSDGKKTKKM
jgi:hypothetical protein